MKVRVDANDQQRVRPVSAPDQWFGAGSWLSAIPLAAGQSAGAGRLVRERFWRCHRRNSRAR